MATHSLLFVATLVIKEDAKLDHIAKQHNASKAQINLAWLLHKSPWTLLIFGTSSLERLQENLKTADIELSGEDLTYLG